MKTYVSLLILACLISLQKMSADPIVNFFLYPFPYAHDIHHTFKHSGKIASHTVEGMLGQNNGAGIFSTYAGYIDITNLNGQTFYPRTQQQLVLHLVVAQTIVPIVMFANTISHWELDKDEPAAFFRLEKKQDEETKMFIWDVQPENRPENNSIPLNPTQDAFLIIIADPRAIYIPIGVSVTDNSPHLLLPPIYVKKEIDRVKNSLYMITVSHLFRPSRILYTKKEKQYVMHTAL
ncbi:MAG: hypothetical protein NT124_01965 [Candidatus Dependentiae bacterium]|nr:hypothetical protein [Candidatus Dependentiae bacterium]